MICAVVLAAGSSRRMGVAKLLLPLAGKPIIAHVVDLLLRQDLAAIYVVIGAHSSATALKTALSGRQVHFLTQSLPDAAMLDSLRCGLRALPEACRGVLVALGDQPLVLATSVQALLERWPDTRKGILVPTVNGRRGHPILVSTRHVPELLREHDGTGLRGLLATQAKDVEQVETGDPGIRIDIDTPEDYGRWGGSGSPGGERNREVSEGQA